jgi:hypothetical protein
MAMSRTSKVAVRFAYLATSAPTSRDEWPDAGQLHAGRLEALYRITASHVQTQFSGRAMMQIDAVLAWPLERQLDTAALRLLPIVVDATAANLEHGFVGLGGTRRLSDAYPCQILPAPGGASVILSTAPSVSCKIESFTLTDPGRRISRARLLPGVTPLSAAASVKSARTNEQTIV